MATKVKALIESMWLPGFGPDEDPLILADYEPPMPSALVIPFPAAPAVEPEMEIQAEEVQPMVTSVTVAFEPESEPEPAQRFIWPTLTHSVLDGLGGEVGKYEANMSALRVMQVLSSEDRYPTDEERLILNRYTGWGGLPKVFNPDQSDPSWASRGDALKGLLGDEQFVSARESVNNAHFTEIRVIEWMWEALRRFGFKGGRVVEPAGGVGYFLGAMPQDIAEASEVTAIEIDTVSAGILSKLYGQGARVLNCGFEKANLADEWYDLVISNVPFGNYQVPDVNGRAYSDWNIHDYYFGRALDLVRPGGLIAFITSTGTLDKQDDTVRRYLASKAKLLGAVRLPANTFKRVANTELTSSPA